MPDSKVSVVMSVYNGARYLRPAIDSILAQTFADFELLIVDDGSRDESPAILDGIRDGRVRLIRTENRGLAAALERGVRETRSPLIARMDADDIAMPDRLETQIGYLDRHPQIGLVGSNYVEIDAQDSAVRLRSSPALSEPDMVGWKLLWENVVCHPAVMFRRGVLEAAGATYDPAAVVEDYDLWTRLMFHTRFGHVPRVLLRYRLNPAGMTGTRDRRQLEATGAIQQRTLSALLGRDAGPGIGLAVAVLSRQTAAPPDASEGLPPATTLVALATEARAAFLRRFAPPPAARRAIDADLANRLLDWGRFLAQVPGRAGDATGVLLRQALALRPRVAFSRRVARNVAGRLLRIPDPAHVGSGPASQPR